MPNPNGGLNIPLKEKAALKVGEVAQVLSCSRSKVYKMVEEGLLRPVKLGSGRSSGVRITWKEIHRFLNGESTNVLIRP